MEEIEYVAREETHNYLIEMDDLIEYINQFKKKYPDGTDFYVEASSWTDTDDFTYSEIILSCLSPQTEEEKQEELERNRRNEEQGREYRRTEYEKLKKEFEGGLKWE